MNPQRLTGPLRVLRACLHALMAGLLGLAVARALVSHMPNAPLVIVAAVVVAVVYGAGPLLPKVGGSILGSAAWLVMLAGAWLVLLWLTPDGVWVAFPLFFIQLHLLPLRWGMTMVGCTTVLAIIGFAWHQHEFTPAAAIGPALGAAVAVATVLGYQALYRESEQRRKLIDELTAARHDLALVERSAGVLVERERLAREIHDTLAQGLSSIQLLLRAAERALPSQPDDAEDYVRQARIAAQGNLTEARRFVYALTPADLDGKSLPSALERLCGTTTEQSGVAVRLRVSGNQVPLPTPDEVALLRIAQSALANTVAHASANRVEVTLSYMDSDLALDIVDDGIGFDVATVSHTAGAASGFGIAAMRARVSELGGKLSVESEYGQGTALAVNLPYQRGQAATSQT